MLRKKEARVVITFRTTTAAMQTEALAQEKEAVRTADSCTA